MTLAEKFDLFNGLIRGMDYDHREGGKYVYVQFLSFTREILDTLEAFALFEKECRTVTAIRDTLNEALCHRFGEEQRRVFYEKRQELLTLLSRVRTGFNLRSLSPGLAEEYSAVSGSAA